MKSKTVSRFLITLKQIVDEERRNQKTLFYFKNRKSVRKTKNKKQKTKKYKRRNVSHLLLHVWWNWFLRSLLQFGFFGFFLSVHRKFPPLVDDGFLSIAYIFIVFSRCCVVSVLLMELLHIQLWVVPRHGRLLGVLWTLSGKLCIVVSWKESFLLEGRPSSCM